MTASTNFCVASLAACAACFARRPHWRRSCGPCWCRQFCRLWSWLFSGRMPGAAVVSCGGDLKAIERVMPQGGSGGCRAHRAGWVRHAVRQPFSCAGRGLEFGFYTVLFDQKADRLLLPLLYLSRMQHLQPARLHGSLDAFERPAAPAFSRHAARYRQPLLLRRQPHPRAVPPGRLPLDTARPGVPPQQAAVCLRGYAATRCASRCAASALCPPCGQACLPVFVSVLPYHQSPPSQIGDKLFEVSSKAFQMVVKIVLYLIDIDKTVPQRRYRSHRLSHARAIARPIADNKQGFTP